jgi:hypothetical protein
MEREKYHPKLCSAVLDYYSYVSLDILDSKMMKVIKIILAWCTGYVLGWIVFGLTLAILAGLIL